MFFLETVEWHAWPRAERTAKSHRHVRCYTGCISKAVSSNNWDGLEYYISTTVKQLRGFNNADEKWYVYVKV